MEQQILELLTEIRDSLKQQNEPQILFVKDVAKIMKINHNAAAELWYKPNFPGITDIGHRKVEKTAFMKWLQEYGLSTNN